MATTAQHSIRRKFLECPLRFISVCGEPAIFPPLDSISIEPLDPSSLHLIVSARRPGALPPARQSPIGLGFSSNTMGKGVSNSFNRIGNLSSAMKISLSRAPAQLGQWRCWQAVHVLYSWHRWSCYAPVDNTAQSDSPYDKSTSNV